MPALGREQFLGIREHPDVAPGLLDTWMGYTQSCGLGWVSRYFPFCGTVGERPKPVMEMTPLRKLNTEVARLTITLHTWIAGQSHQLAQHLPRFCSALGLCWQSEGENAMVRPADPTVV
jgi:hypothetical protein